ncbi:MAG: hypothetical protein K2K84_04670 [Muribaculaceae bacterium]|nr:hypothetical protein [Muribaculaceae bacterium]
MKASEAAALTADTAKSLVKAAVLSRPVTLKDVHPEGPLVILGNGPSLNTTIAESLDYLKSVDTMAVNFACLAPVFFDIRPRFYILADPLFFGDAHPRIGDFRRMIQKVDWPMTLLVPRKFRRQTAPITGDNKFLGVMTYNFVGLDGFAGFERFVYRRRLGMPRPRNVLVPAIMNAIALGYRTIYVAGADHSWMQTISVDDENHVISVQPHFYKDDSTEQKRVDTTYRGLRLHQVVESFAIAFKAYHSVRRYADSRGVTVTNVTPGSFIDAFDRGRLPSK